MNASKWSKIEYSQGDKRYVGLFLQDEIAQPKAIVVLLPDWRGQGSWQKITPLIWPRWGVLF